MNKKTALIIKNYELAVNALAVAFLNKQFREDGDEPIRIGDCYSNAYWVHDDVGGVLCYGEELFVDVPDMAEDLRLDAPKGKYIEYYDYCLKCVNAGLEPGQSYEAWLRDGSRRTNAEIAEAKFMKERQDEYKNNLTQNISYDYDGD